ncbi:MAG: type II toxin-antitoxin system VapC family toxin [Chloroflexi bacterium]|nr:type II toxin-antitoxin system VapC family toxin [Chloroflexota bacterium]
MIYLESSALAKLVLREAESEALRVFLKSWPQRVSSRLSQVEVLRATRRASPNPAEYQRAEQVIDDITQITMAEDIAILAGTLEPPVLRSLDAIHLATALSLGDDLGGFVTYDERLAEAARAAGITVYAPR